MINKEIYKKYFPGEGHLATNQRKRDLYNYIIETNFKGNIIKIDNISMKRINDRKVVPLMSFSRIFKGINEYNFSKIPLHHLEQAKQDGSNLMVNLEMWFYNYKLQYRDMCFGSELDRNLLITMTNFFKNNGIHIGAIEKCITTDNWIAYIDGLARWKSRRIAIEIKVRGDTKIRKSDKLQCSFYRELLDNIPVLLLIIDKKKLIIKDFLFDKNTCDKGSKITKLFDRFGIIPMERVEIVEKTEEIKEIESWDL